LCISDYSGGCSLLLVVFSYVCMLGFLIPFLRCSWNISPTLPIVLAVWGSNQKNLSHWLLFLRQLQTSYPIWFLILSLFITYEASLNTMCFLNIRSSLVEFLYWE
jgi:hypothetical protein